MVRGDAATSPPPLGEPGFTSTVVDELEDGLGAGDADGDEEESSALGAAADDDELEVLDLSPGVSFCSVWALDELPVRSTWAMAAEPSPKIMSVPRMAAKRDFVMVHLPEEVAATAVPARCGSLT
jgi:hypothetical protein